MMNMLDRYKKRFVFATSSLLRKFEADGALMKRFSRIGFLTDRVKALGTVAMAENSVP